MARREQDDIRSSIFAKQAIVIAIAFRTQDTTNVARWRYRSVAADWENLTLIDAGSITKDDSKRADAGSAVLSVETRKIR